MTTEVREAPRRAADARPGAPSPNPPDPPQAAAAAAPAPPLEPEKKERIIRPLEVGRIQLAHAGFTMNIWLAKVPRGTEWTDVLDPVFFSNKAHEMRTNDIIHVVHDNWAYEGELRVQTPFVIGQGTTPNRVKVYEKSFQKCEPPQPVVNPHDLHVKHMGPHYLWALIREGSPDPVMWGYATQEEAVRARRGYSAARNTPPKG